MVSVWFYDDASDESMQVEAVVHERAFLGVATKTSKKNYSYKLGGSPWYESSVARSTGWYQFVWDMRSVNDCIMYIDIIEIGTFNSIPPMRVLR